MDGGDALDLAGVLHAPAPGLRKRAAFAWGGGLLVPWRFSPHDAKSLECRGGSSTLSSGAACDSHPPFSRVPRRGSPGPLGSDCGEGLTDTDVRGWRFKLGMLRGWLAGIP